MSDIPNSPHQIHNTGDQGLPQAPSIQLKPIPRGKPFYKSKGFWGGALTIASAFLPGPAGKLATLAGGALGLYGRAAATQKLTLGTDNELSDF